MWPKEALEAEEGIQIKVESYDKLGDSGHDLAADSPFVECHPQTLWMESTLDSHAKEGGPPPVRSREWPYGLPRLSNVKRTWEQSHREGGHSIGQGDGQSARAQGGRGGHP